jgi:hypothetical protein
MEFFKQEMYIQNHHLILKKKIKNKKMKITKLLQTKIMAARSVLFFLFFNRNI